MSQTFHVIRLSDEAPARDGNHHPRIFLTGEAAAMEARRLTDLTSTKWQPRPIKAGDWRERERARFADATYQPLPRDWTTSYWWSDNRDVTKDHFAHPSKEEPGKIAFTASEEDGEKDRQTRLKAGVYLTRYFAHLLTAAAIAELAATFSEQMGVGLKLRFARTSRAIKTVYLNGPSSCMSHAVDDYDCGNALGIHPVEVYNNAKGTLDLAIAYIKREDKRITARTLCWPAKKVYGRVYGDAVRLKPLLERAGYKQGNFHGARLRKVVDRHGSRVVCPYIDAGYGSGPAGEPQAVKVQGEYLVFGRSGSGGCSESGWMPIENTYACERCDDDVTRTYAVTTNGGDTQEEWCRDCRNDHAVSVGGEWVDIDDTVELNDGRYVTQAWFDENGGTCEFYGESCDADGMDEVHVVGHGGSYTTQRWCNNAIVNEALRCPITNQLWHREAMYKLSDGRCVSPECEAAVNDRARMEALLEPITPSAWELGQIAQEIAAEWAQARRAVYYGWTVPPRSIFDEIKF